MAIQNIIEIVIKSIDQMGQGVNSAVSSLDRLENSVNGINAGSQKATSSVKQLSPVLEQTAAGATTAGAAIGIATKAVGLLGAAIGVLAGVAIAVILFNALNKAATALKEWAYNVFFAEAQWRSYVKAIRDADIGVFQVKIKDLTDAIDNQRVTLEFLQKQYDALSKTGFDTRGIKAGIDSTTKSIAEQNLELEQNKQLLELIQQRRAAEKLPDLIERISQERTLLGLNEAQRIAAEANIRVQQSLKSINDENLTAEQMKNVAAVQSQIQTLATAKANELVTNTTRAFTAGIDAQIRALNAEVIALQQGEAAARRYVDAQQALETKRRTGVTVDPRQIEAKNVKLDTATQKNLAAKREAAAISAREKADDQDRLETTEITAEAWKQIVAARTSYITGPLQIELITEQNARDLAQIRLQLAKELEAPGVVTLALAKQLDQAERQIYDTQIKQLEAMAEQFEALGQLVEAEKARAAAAGLRAKADLLEGATTRSITLDLRRQAELMATNLAKDFTDRFIALMKGEELRIQDFFANLGETIVSQFLQAAMKALIEQPLLDLLTQLGGKTVGQYTQAGIGGALFGFVKEQFFPSVPAATPGAPTAPSAPILSPDVVTQIADFADMVDGAGEAIDSIADAASQATTALSGISTAISQGVLDISLTTTAAAVDALGASALGASLSLDTLVFSTKLASTAMDDATRAAFELANALRTATASTGTSGGSGLGGLIGLLSGGGDWSGATTGGGFDAWDMGGFAKGGIVVPRGFVKPFQQGGVVRGPVIGMIGEEGPEIVARMKPARAQDYASEQPKVQVIIEGDIIPRRPEMTPDDVIRIVTSNGTRTRDSGIGGMVRNIIKRER